MDSALIDRKPGTNPDRTGIVFATPLHLGFLPLKVIHEVFGLLDRLTHHVNILEMNGENFRLNQSNSRLAKI